MTKSQWQLQEAKNRFSEVVELAIKQGAQTVTKHGKPAVVVVSVEEYQRTRRPQRTLVELLQSCPEDLSQLLGKRSQEPARTIRFD